MTLHNDDERPPLPEGWVWTTIGECCDVIMGQSPPSSTYNEDKIGLPFYQGKAEFEDLYPTPVKWCSKPQKIANAGDILISVRAPVGPTNLCCETSCIGRGLSAIRPQEGIPNLYVFYYLRHIEHEWEAKATGSTFSAISGKVLRDQEIPLAPLPEQYRIVEAIERHFTRLDAVVAALERVKRNLVRYKASVLQAACTGRLIREEEVHEAACKREATRSPQHEDGATLLQRILAERRARWEVAHPGKRYVEPSPPDTRELPSLPEGWVWTTVEQLAAHEENSITDGPFGSKLKTAHYAKEGARVIRLQNIGQGNFKDEYAFINPEHFETLRKHEVFAGDVVIAALGNNLPRSCIIPDFVGPAIVKADCIRFKPHSDIGNTRYLNVALNSEM